MSRLPKQLSTKTGEAQRNGSNFLPPASGAQTIGLVSTAGAIDLLINSPHPIQFGFLHTIYGVPLGWRNRAPGTNLFRD
jgi:hypothetical protein